MKAGLVIAVYVLKALHEYGYDKRPIRVVQKPPGAPPAPSCDRF